MKQFKKIAALLIVLSFVLGLCGCGETEIIQDSSDLTMYVGLGQPSTDYYANLHDLILEKTGIDVKYVYTNSMDTTNSMVVMLENYDLPADIIVTASFSPEEAQKNSLLDLASYTNLSDLFTTTKLNQVAIEGAIYQLPFATRLIGVEYNKTLLEEMGWTLPSSFNEMLELKKKADAAGITFAISGGAATGHGFNYLMHLMGTDFLSSPSGTQWLNDFFAGETDVSEFAEHAEYFKKYKEAGLFGELHDETWSSAPVFKEERALFYYNILNDARSDEGGDEYGSMPWISENGSCNCFTSYDNIFIGLDKKLAQPEYQDKLSKAIKVLECMASEDATKLFSESTPDGYVATQGYNVESDRLYYEYADHITAGYTQPWYYNYFDTDSIVAVGQAVNDYIKGDSNVSFDDIMNALEEKNEARLSKSEGDYVAIDEEFSFEDCAKLEAAAAGISLQNALDKAGLHKEVSAALMPYTESLNDLPLYNKIGVAQQKLYAGHFSYNLIQTLINSTQNQPVAVVMTGAEIKALANKGLSALEDYDKNVTFKYALVTKNSFVLDDKTKYYVAICEGSLSSSDYKALADSGKIVIVNGEAIRGNVVSGIEEIFDANKKLHPGNYWMK